MTITHIRNRKLLTITHGNKLGIGIGMIIWDGVQVWSEVISGPCIRNPSGLVRLGWDGGGHGCKLGWWMAALVCVVYPLIAVKGCMTKFVADLACGARGGVWERLGILRCVVIREITTVGDIA